MQHKGDLLRMKIHAHNSVFDQVSIPYTVVYDRVIAVILCRNVYMRDDALFVAQCTLFLT